MHVLLVEDNPGDVRLLRETLAEVDASQFALTAVATLAEAQQRLASETFDLVLSDLSLPDSHGLATFQRLFECAPDVPVIVLTGMNNEEMAVTAVQSGAQDYLVKGQVDSHLLARAMRYAVERHRMQVSLRSLTLIDELTGLHNRRGFLTLADQQLKFACRAKHRLLLLFADLDGMKFINDTYGHHEGDCALVKIADILRETLRDSDLIARIGGDEFVVLAFEVGPNSIEVLPARLEQGIDACNTRGGLPYQLSLSIGADRFDPEYPCGLDELLARADAMMYAKKRLRKLERGETVLPR
ncbi:MAG TPA: diguanylate cyclase [Armatimonadota bacterium]|jgi:diguanylate cyclase (GGDEF)-like protein